MSKGTMMDFLALVAETPALARDLVELAARYDFAFTRDELSDADLDAVAGGTASETLATMGEDAQLAQLDMQNALQHQQQTLQTMSNVSKMLHDAQASIVRKVGG